MIAPKHAATAAVLAASVLTAVGPAQAFSARQATAQGQGIFVTSSGVPQNFIAPAAVTQQGDNAERRPLRSLEHHDRYFTNN